MGKSALILEGGALRGNFTSGVLDVWMEEGLWTDAVAGTSAGALNGLYYAARQPHTAIRVNTEFARDSHYVGLRAFAASRSFVNFDYLFDDICKERIPFDFEGLEHSPIRYMAVATNCDTGKAAYFEKGGPVDVYQAARASSSMPLFSPFVTLEGEPYLDGGISCSFPLQWALDEGYEKIVVVTTRPLGFRKERLSKRMKDLYYARYRHWPELMKALLYMPVQYNKLMDLTDRLAEEGRILVVRPAAPLAVDRLERDPDKLQLVYSQGREQGLRAVPALRELLAE